MYRLVTLLNLTSVMLSISSMIFLSLSALDGRVTYKRCHVYEGLELDPSLNADPNSNYEILSKILCDAKTNHIPRRSKKTQQTKR